MAATKDNMVKPTATLQDLENARREVQAWVHEEAAANDGELPEWLEQLQLEAEEAADKKIDRVRGFIHSQSAQITTIDAEVSRLTARKAVRVARIDRLTRYVQVVMGQAGIKKIETALGTTSRRGHGGVRPFLFVASPEELVKHELTKPFVTTVTPEPFLKTDTSALRDFLEANGADEVVVNVELLGITAPQRLVHLGQRGETVLFK